MRIICFIILLSTLNSSFCHSQSETDKKLAIQHFQNEEYDKAVLLYEKLHNNSGLIHYYNYYLDCLLKLNYFKKAEKLTKKEIKKNPEKPIYQVDLGYIYQLSGETQKAKQQYEKTLKGISNEKQQIISLANAFSKKNELDFAIRTYLKGRKNIIGESFHMQLANVYSKANYIEEMIEESLL